MTEMRGIYSIPLTPFKENLEIDYDDYKKVVEFSLACGSHGIVAPVNASEFATMTQEERDKIVDLTIKTVNGAVHVSIGCTGKTAEDSLSCIRYAQDKGADSVVVMPPVESRLNGEDELYGFYEKVNDTAKIPVFLQNIGLPSGTPMTAEFMVKLIRDFKHIYMIKEETEFATHLMDELCALTKDMGKDVYGGHMGGKGCRYLIAEYARGACGNMPSCHIADVLVDLWTMLENGETELAWDLYEKALVMFNFEALYRLPSYKEILRRRGIIKTSKHRAQVPAQPMDEKALVELDKIISRLRPYFKVQSM